MRPVKAMLTAAALVTAWQAAAWPGAAQAGPAAKESEVAVTGRYRNLDYAYSVRIPNSLCAYRMKAPAPNHGIDMHIPGNEGDILLVDGSFDAAGYGSAEASAKHYADYYKGEYGLTQVRVSRAVLSGLDARDVILRRRGRGDQGRTNYVRLVVGFRPIGDDNTSVIYTVSVLASTPDSAVVKAFSEVLDSFRALPLPKRNR